MEWMARFNSLLEVHNLGMDCAYCAMGNGEQIKVIFFGRLETPSDRSA